MCIYFKRIRWVQMLTLEVNVCINYRKIYEKKLGNLSYLFQRCPEATRLILTLNV